jgi:putative Mg2+ transporter-C (MgtC) family protein
MTHIWGDFSEVLVRLLAATAAGAAIGLNRFLRGKPAGFGTHALVSLGAGLATLIMARAPGTDAGAVSRVIQGLVTGVGFIGAGEIMRGNRDGDVHGLTTAASVWAAAIIGIGCGMAEFVVCATGVALTLIILILSKPFEELVARLLKRGHEPNP